jgi:mRNA interferase HigB
MHVFSRNTLRNFWQANPGAEEALKSWFYEAEHANWKTPSDVKQRYGSADILPGNRVVFNIKGNNYRLVIKINYSVGDLYIRFVGTHAEYDKIDAETI